MRSRLGTCKSFGFLSDYVWLFLLGTLIAVCSDVANGVSHARQSYDTVSHFENAIPSTFRGVYTSESNKRILNHPLTPALLQASLRQTSVARVQRAEEANKPLRLVEHLDDAIENDSRRTPETRVHFKRLSGPDANGLSTWRVHDHLKPAPFDVLVPEDAATGHVDRMYNGKDEMTRLELLRTQAERRREMARRRKIILQLKRSKGRKAMAFDDLEEVSDALDRPAPSTESDNDESDGSTSTALLVKRTNIDREEKDADDVKRASEDPLGRVAMHDGTAPLWGSFARAFWATLELVPQNYIDSYWFERASPDLDTHTRLALWIAFEAPDTQRGPDEPLVLRFPWFLFVDTQRKRESLIRGEWHKIGEARTLQQDGQQGASARIYFDPEKALSDVKHLWRNIGKVHKFTQLSPPGTPGLLRFCITGVSLERLKADPHTRPDMRSFNFWLSPPSSGVEPQASFNAVMAGRELRPKSDTKIKGRKRKYRPTAPHVLSVEPHILEKPIPQRPKLYAKPPVPSATSPQSGTTDPEDFLSLGEEVQDIYKKRSMDYDEPVDSDISTELEAMPYIRPDAVFRSVNRALRKLAHNVPGVRSYTYMPTRVVLSYQEFLLRAYLVSRDGHVHVVGTFFYVPNTDYQLHGLQKRELIDDSTALQKTIVLQHDGKKRSIDDDGLAVLSDVQAELEVMPEIDPLWVFPNIYAATRATSERMGGIDTINFLFERVIMSFREYRMTAVKILPNGTRLPPLHKMIYIQNRQHQMHGMAKRDMDADPTHRTPASGPSAPPPMFDDGAIFRDITEVMGATSASLGGMFSFSLRFQRVVNALREYRMTVVKELPDGTSITIHRTVYIPVRQQQGQEVAKRELSDNMTAQAEKISGPEQNDSQYQRRGLTFDPYMRPLQLPAYHSHAEALRAIDRYWPDYTDIHLQSAHRLIDQDQHDMVAYSYNLTARSPNGHVVRKRFDFYRKMWVIYQPLHVFNTLAEARRAFAQSHPTLRGFTWGPLRALSNGEESDVRRYRYTIDLAVSPSHAVPTTDWGSMTYDFYLRNMPSSPSTASSSDPPPSSPTLSHEGGDSPGWPWSEGSVPSSSSSPAATSGDAHAHHVGPSASAAQEQSDVELNEAQQADSGDNDEMQERDGGEHWRTTPDAIELVFGRHRAMHA